MGIIFYTNSEHKHLLLQLFAKYGKIYPRYGNSVDSYYLSAFYILTSSKDLRNKCLKHIDDIGIDFVKIRRIDMGSGHKLLVQLAGNLFNGNSKVVPLDLIGSLDDDNFEVAMQAIRLRRSSVHLDDLL